MIGVRPIDNWESLVGFIFIVVVTGIVLMVVLVRNPHTRRTRVGFFVEREVERPLEEEEHDTQADA